MGTCPLLDEDKLVCKANISRVLHTSTGKKVEYQPLTTFEVDKCRDPALWPKCPDYLKTKSIICPECGQVYLPQNAVEVFINGKTMKACPQCGATQYRR